MSCVTLMANRSDRRLQTLSPRMAARGRETDQPNEARGNPSRPGLHLTPDKQAGYMTATEFQIAPAIQPLTRAGSIYAWRSGMNRSSLEDGGWRILRCLIRSPSQTSGQPPMEAANNRPGLIGG